MTSMELLELLGSVRDQYVVEAHSEAAPGTRFSFKRPLLIAAMIALMLLLVGCTYAYVQGWFTDFFAARSQEPLSSEQIEFIQENEQIIQETQSKGGWTVELKSAICAGDTGYIIFGVTAPADIDLEYHNIETPNDSECITPGNLSQGRDYGRALIVASTGWYSEELNYCWQEHGYWQEDNDGIPNTLNYIIETRYEKLYPDREMLAENLFTGDTEFTVTFDCFYRDYEDPEVRKAIDEKYAGMTDYMVADEDMIGLFQGELLAEGEWKFQIDFKAAGAEPVELISEPVMTWGIVSWKLTDDPLFYETGSGMAAVKIVSFVLNPFGAAIQYEFEDPAYNAFIEYQDHFGYEDRYIYAVMKDGSQIALHTDSVGTQLAAETPIVLSEVDHILLGDMDEIQRGEGVIIPMPE